MNQKEINIHSKTIAEKEITTTPVDDNLQKTEVTDNKTTTTKNSHLTAITTIETDTHKNKNTHNTKNHVINQSNSLPKSPNITTKSKRT